jgi:archaellum component FlaC
MAGENAYLKGMEPQLKIVAEKVDRAKVEAPIPEVEKKLEEVNQKFNALRDENPETFDEQRGAFETAFSELSRMVTDNRELRRGEIKLQDELTKQTGVVGRG